MRSLLAPMEYTRLDEMVDVMFTTATDVEAAIVSDDGNEEDEPNSENGTVSKSKGVWQFTDSRLLQRKREDIIAVMGRASGTNFIKKSRALYWDSAHEKRIASTKSKRYTKRASYPYWYAYHPQWDDFLRDGKTSFVILGCVS
jgi:hypothetical protein